MLSALIEHSIHLLLSLPYCRCISTEKRNEQQLRGDLKDWLLVAKQPISAPSSSFPATGKGRRPSLTTNYHNKRLAMMALFAVRDLKASDFSSTYRHLLS
jgi:hypothetical protein